VEEMAFGKLDSEVLLDELRTVAVNVAGKLDRFFFALSALFQTAHSFFEGGVDENVEGIVLVS